MTLQMTKEHCFDIVFDSRKVLRFILGKMLANPSLTKIGECNEGS